MQPLRISAVIPALKESGQIAAAIASARAAGFDEILVVDGGSDDGTREAATTADRVLVSPAGRAMQQNLGAAHASGEILFFLHADCRPAPGTAAAIRQALTAQPRAVAGCLTQRIDAPGWRYRLLEWGNLRRVLWFGMAYGDQGIFLRATTFHAVGGFPEWPLLEDVELMRRLRGQGRLLVINSPLLVSARRWQQRGVVRQTLRNWLILSLFFCGVSPVKLAKLYTHIR